MATKLLANQLRSILNDPVEGFTVELADEANMFEWKVYIEGPKDTYYSGGIFQLSLRFPNDYPMSPPVLKFISDFWHPNVFADGKVCMSILHPPGEDAMSGELPEERWLPTQSVTTIVLSLISILSDPNFASPANVDASVEWRKNGTTYKARCLKLVEKANRERPEHVVIPHPESDVDQRRRRVEKLREITKLEEDDFYDEGGNGDEGEEEPDDDDNDEMGSEADDHNSGSEVLSNEEENSNNVVAVVVNEKKKSMEVKKEIEVKKEKEVVVEVKKEEVKRDKGKEKLEEIISTVSSSNNENVNNIANNNNNTYNNNNNISPAPVVQSSENSASAPPSTKKKSRKGKKNGGKCAVM